MPLTASAGCEDGGVAELTRRIWPETAEALMRSRFEAFRDGDADWLLASWHNSTRPASLDLTQNPRWRGLQIVDTVAGTETDDTGIVEFKATYFRQQDLQVLHERSRFVRADGRWYYLDAVDTVL
jgi:SEC-C motif-containing protein